MTFGGQADQATAGKMVDYCLEEGINFFDTANMYQTGLSEEMLGTALEGKRDKVVLASKVFAKMGDAPDQGGLSKAAILRAAEDSLKRLKTDYLDLYYLHQPDYEVPIYETLEAMDLLVKEGKIRYPAISNYSSWQTCEMLWIAERENYQPVVAAQQMYNLLARGLEQEFVSFAENFEVSLIAYNPLAGGLLTGKHNSSQIAEGTRFDRNKMYQDRYWHSENFNAVEKLSEITKQDGRSLISLALNWVLHHTAADCVILGASRMEQLEQNIAVLAEGALSAKALAACNGVWKNIRGSVPLYNR